MGESNASRPGDTGPQHAQVRIGTSGYQYKHWRDIFYPRSIRQCDWFAHYAEFFDTVELNNTFYRLPQARTFECWRERTPPGFCYALKYSRYGSHIMHLKNAEAHLSQYLANAELLGSFLGPILVQLPPHWKVDVGRLEEFLAAAPRRHRWALEFRHESWICPEVFAILRAHHAALCIHDKIPEHPWQLTANWTYIRYHGGNYDGNYSQGHLRNQAERIRRIHGQGTDVYVYFNNDVHGHALMNAADLREFVTGRKNLLRQTQWFW